MAIFNGYLLKATKTGQLFPERYIEKKTWSSDPMQVEYLKFYRDDYTRNTTKVAAKGRKSKFEFTTIGGLSLSQREEIEKFFNDNQLNDEGDIELQYWDDKNLVYRIGNFYRPNMNFKIITHEEDDIVYDALTFKFIEN